MTRETNHAFNAPVNVGLGLRKDSGRSEERGEGACSNTAPPRSGLNPCGKQTGLPMRRSMLGEGLRVDWGGARNAVRGMLKHGSSTLRPESLRKNNRAFNAPVNVQEGACPEPVEGLREDSGRSEERGEGACSNTSPPRSALNSCGKQPGHSTRDQRTMSPSDTAMSPSDTATGAHGGNRNRHRKLPAPSSPCPPVPCSCPRHEPF